MHNFIVCVDDFGATSGINIAVERLYYEGTITHVALMANGEKFSEAIKILQKCSNLKCGLHFVLTDEKPCIAHSSLVNPDTGCFYSRKDLLLKLLFLKITFKDINKELIAQADKITSTGIPIHFINGHQHSHVLPFVSYIICKYCKVNNLYVRNTFEIFKFSLSFKWLIKKLFGLILALHHKFFIYITSVKTNDIFVSNFKYIHPTFSSKESISLLKRSRDDSFITEFMVHPSLPDPSNIKFWYVNKNDVNDRVKEFNSLSSEEFKLFLVN